MTTKSGRLPREVFFLTTPIHSHFDQLFESVGVKAPKSILESGSLTLMPELLDRSDHPGLMSGGQAKAEIRRGVMTALPFSLPHASRPIGIPQRAGRMPAAAR
jgi:hypothetical protein